MLSRVGLVLGASGAVVGWQANQVDAASEPDKKKKVQPSELPIYDNLEPVELELVPEWEGSFHKKVSDVRKKTWTYLDSIQDTTGQVRDKLEIAKAHTSDTLAYIQDDSSVVARAAIITVSGLGGIVAGYKRGAIRKTLYAATAIAAASSVCYPQQAVVVGREGYRVAADFAHTTYHDLFDAADAKKSVKPASKTEPAEKTTVAAGKNPSSPKMDFGMSKPEDKDMYTTRGS